MINNRYTNRNKTTYNRVFTLNEGYELFVFYHKKSANKSIVFLTKDKAIQAIGSGNTPLEAIREMRNK